MPALIFAIGSWIVAIFSRVIASRIGSWIISALLFLGLSFGTQTLAVAPLTSLIRTYWASIGSDIVQWLTYCNIDRAITITLSAIAARAVIGGAKVALRRRGA